MGKKYLRVEMSSQEEVVRGYHDSSVHQGKSMCDFRMYSASKELK